MKEEYYLLNYGRWEEIWDPKFFAPLGDECSELEETQEPLHFFYPHLFFCIRIGELLESDMQNLAKTNGIFYCANGTWTYFHDEDFLRYPENAFISQQDGILRVAIYDHIESTGTSPLNCFYEIRSAKSLSPQLNALCMRSMVTLNERDPDNESHPKTKEAIQFMRRIVRIADEYRKSYSAESSLAIPASHEDLDAPTMYYAAKTHTSEPGEVVLVEIDSDARKDLMKDITEPIVKALETTITILGNFHSKPIQVQFYPDETPPEDIPDFGKDGFWVSQEEYVTRIGGKPSSNTLSSYREKKHKPIMFSSGIMKTKGGHYCRKTEDKTNSPYEYFMRYPD